MNDGSEYAEMLQTMASSCDLVVKPAKRQRRRKDVKEDLVAKVNLDAAGESFNDAATLFADKPEEPLTRRKRGSFFKKAADKAENDGKKKFGLDIVYIEGIIAFVLVAAILLTNIFWENSGINVLFKKAFTPAQTVTDARSYSSFNAQSPSSSLEPSVSDGVMTFSGKGALYPVCDGKVSALEKSADGKYTITIAHSGTFSTVISGADFAYCESGEDVFKYVPVCYLNGGEATVTMYDEDSVLTNYALENGSIVWSV